jgi:hypothetical protein
MKTDSKGFFMDEKYGLENISTSTKQTIYQALSQAMEDYHETEASLGLITHNSKHPLIWDFFNRNLSKSFSQDDILYTAKKCGMWEISLLYDRESKLILSFMKDKRFKSLQEADQDDVPQYIQALLLLNNELEASVKQQALFSFESDENPNHLQMILNSICKQFKEPIKDVVKYHALVVFSEEFGMITLLKAYILDKDLGIVDSDNWLDQIRPIMPQSHEIDLNNPDDPNKNKAKQLKLTDKAKKRRQKDNNINVILRDAEEQKEG